MTEISPILRVVQAVNFIILSGWLVMLIVALVRLRRCRLGEVARVLWVIVVVLLPIIGALAFFIVNPGRQDQSRPGTTRET